MVGVSDAARAPDSAARSCSDACTTWRRCCCSQAVGVWQQTASHASCSAPWNHHAVHDHWPELLREAHAVVLHSHGQSVWATHRPGKWPFCLARVGTTAMLREAAAPRAMRVLLWLSESPAMRAELGICRRLRFGFCRRGKTQQHRVDSSQMVLVARRWQASRV